MEFHQHPNLKENEKHAVRIFVLIIIALGLLCAALYGINQF